MKQLNTTTIFQWILNGLIIAVALVLVGFAVKRQLGSGLEVFSSGRRPAVGSVAELSGIDWSGNGTTLIFALQTECRWCEESVGFYRTLLLSNTSDAFQPIAVFPQPVTEGRAFLRSHRIYISEVYEANFRDLVILGTPTLILVNSDGLIEASWAGKLGPRQENEVFSKLGIERARDVNLRDPEVNIHADPVYLDDTRPIIDIRRRPQFNDRHIDGSLNIPLDELETRTTHEIPTDIEVLVFCAYDSTCETTARSEGVETYCGFGERILRELGFSQLRMIEGDLAHLESAGVKLVTESPRSFTYTVNEQ